MIFNATTNQKQASATEGSAGGRCAGQEIRGKRDTIVFGGGEVKGRKKSKIN
jgi:hypothetical protein